MSAVDLRQIPKVELHRHLELTLRLSTMKELAQSAGLKVPDSDEQLKSEWLITEPMQDLDAVLKKFLLTRFLLSNEEILTRITYEAIEDAHNEGIRILELRYAPTYIQEGHPHLNFDRIHRAIVKGMEQARHLPIAVGLIILIQRTLPMSAAESVTDFAIANRGEIIALDLADSEVGCPPGPFARFFDRAIAAGLNITVHAGEANIPEAAQNVCDSIEKLGAQRIGHGVQIVTSFEAVQLVKEKKVPLELCVTSNWLTNATPLISMHPFRQLMNSGVLVTLNTDDPGIFDIDLVHEYQMMHHQFGFRDPQFTQLNDVAASASFLPFELKQKHWPRPIDRSLAPLSNR